MAHAAPTLMFCLGATKAGTSWLHTQLAQHPECYVRSVKELHYFDGLENGHLARQRDEAKAAIERLVAKVLEAGPEKRDELEGRIADRRAWANVLGRGEDIDAYLAYLTDGAAARRLVADITPAYGLLPEERLMQMAALLPDVRFVYLMRDPVDRLWSHVRMNAARRSGGALDGAAAHAMLDAVLAGEHADIARRSDYRAVLEKLDRVARSDQCLAMFYEDLFEPGGAERLCQFLEITPMQAETGRRVHAGLPVDLDPKAARRARAWLSGQYDYVMTRFGAVPAAWRAEEAEV